MSRVAELCDQAAVLDAEASGSTRADALAFVLGTSRAEAGALAEAAVMRCLEALSSPGLFDDATKHEIASAVTRAFIAGAVLGVATERGTRRSP